MPINNGELQKDINGEIPKEQVLVESPKDK